MQLVANGHCAAGPCPGKVHQGLATTALLRRVQGPTSSGKTSLVAHLAAQTGHEFVRINNHQGTDLQVRPMSSAMHTTNDDNHKLLQG